MFDDSKYIELIYADLKPEANDGLKFSGVVKVNVQFFGKNEKKGINHEHNVYLHVKLSDGYVVVGKVNPFRQLTDKSSEGNVNYNSSFRPLYFRFSHTSGGFGRPRMTEFYLIYEHIRVMHDKKIKDNYFLNYNGNHLKIPRRLGWINQIYGKDWLRTLIYVYRPTAPGQSVHIIGARPSSKMYTISTQDVPIYHTNVKDKSKKLIREQDDKLSWVPLRKRLGSEYKNMPLGTPLDWTTDDPCCPTSWLNSGYGFDETNSELHLGPHYWLLDIIVDSSYCETNEDSDSDYGYQDDLDEFDFDPYNSDHYSPKYKGSHSLRQKYEQLSNNRSLGYSYNNNEPSEDGRGNTFKFKLCDENGNIEGAYLNGGGGLTRVAQCGMINIIEYGVPGSERYIPMDGIRIPIRYI
jgi:hypothetical protein